MKSSCSRFYQISWNKKAFLISWIFNYVFLTLLTLHCRQFFKIFTSLNIEIRTFCPTNKCQEIWYSKKKNNETSVSDFDYKKVHYLHHSHSLCHYTNNDSIIKLAVSKGLLSLQIITNFI